MYDRLKFLDHPKEDQDRVEKSDLSKDKKPLTSIPSNSGAQSVGAVNRLPGANNAKGEEDKPGTAASVSHVHCSSAPLLSSQAQSQSHNVGGSILDQLLPAKQNGLNLIDFFIFARQILSFRFSATENDDSKGVVKNMGGWDNLAKKSQCAALKVDATAQFELFRKQAKQKEDRRRQLKDEEEKRRKIKEQEERDRREQSNTADNSSLDDERLMRQREQLVSVQRVEIWFAWRWFYYGVVIVGTPKTGSLEWCVRRDQPDGFDDEF
ncbi:unnamed protein product [Enterobius vermicularis]|uniref:BRD4_CDT domain-containing protein n=1 Tax=Enterobius vermicularis TaxID=51028 RepID=A0A0N4UXW4_ENTVE|nr:unnamed protein product [Enterobius vermicularis]